MAARVQEQWLFSTPEKKARLILREHRQIEAKHMVESNFRGIIIIINNSLHLCRCVHDTPNSSMQI